MYLQLSKLRVYPLAVVATTIMGSLFSPVYANQEPYQQQFVITAYYSPLPGQCCYFRGNYEDEIIFNGKGTNGADGTAVYAGMLAGPPTYDFGTVISLDGIGVGTIHDRGGRIIEWGDDLHRLDIWMGSGEEGLARAMAWGVRKVKGTVYPIGTRPPSESLELRTFAADTNSLKSLPKSDEFTTLIGLELNDNRYGVRLLQQQLVALGYLDHSVTGLYGPATQAALKAFQTAMGIEGDGKIVSERTAAGLIAALKIKDASIPVIAVGLQRGSDDDDVRQAQKILRYLGFYRGRTDGKFDADVRTAVVAFQRSAGVINSEHADGAGRIGPKTQQAMLAAWQLIQAKKHLSVVLLKREIAERVKDESGSKVLVQGDRGQAVKQLQLKLSELGFFKASQANANFGAKTKAAVIAYQLSQKIITSENAHGAGVVGPATRQSLFADAVAMEWSEVREKGL